MVREFHAIIAKFAEGRELPERIEVAP